MAFLFLSKDRGIWQITSSSNGFKLNIYTDLYLFGKLKSWKISLKSPRKEMGPHGKKEKPLTPSNQFSWIVSSYSVYLMRKRNYWNRFEPVWQVLFLPSFGWCLIYQVRCHRSLFHSDSTLLRSLWRNSGLIFYPSFGIKIAHAQEHLRWSSYRIGSLIYIYFTICLTT